MTKLDKLLATTAFAALLGVGLAVTPYEAFAAGAKNPCAPKATKASNPCAPKAANPCASKESGKSDMGKDKSEKTRDKFDYPRFNPNYLIGIGSN